MARALRLWGPVVAWMAVIFTASAQSDVGAVGRIPDWITHGSGYLILALLVCRGSAGGLGEPISIRAALVGVAFCAAYGIADEFHQSFVPGRDASAGDVAKDLGGSVAGAFLYRRFGAGLPVRPRMEPL